MQDFFSKHDINGDRLLEFDEFKKIYQNTGQELKAKTFDQICLNFNPEINNQLSKLTYKGFFEWILMHLNKDQAQAMEFLKNSGYSSNLISKRSRLFFLTFHSSNIIKIITKDGLKDNMDFIANSVMIKAFGSPISKNQGGQDQAEAFFYHNKKINSFSYGVLNKSNKPIKATLDVVKSKFMTQNLKEDFITKIVEPNSMEFMIHSLPHPDEPTVVREASLTYKVLEES